MSGARVGPGVPDLSVLHSAQVWLPLTQTWLHNQVRFLPGDVRSAVAADRLDGAGAWTVRPVHRLRPSLVDRVRRQAPRQWRTNALVRLARRHRAQLLHSHFGNVGWEDLAAASAAGAAHFTSFYGQDLTRFPAIAPVWGERYRELLASGAHILCEGPHMASVARRYGADAKVHVHHLGVEVSTIRFEPRRLAKGEPLRVLLAGSFREKKGHPDGLRALGLLARERDVEVTLVGDAEPGREASQQEKARIEAAIAESGLGPRLRRTGFVAHADLLREAYGHHLFLAPSRTAADGDTEGGAPVGLIEMAATGLPVVATRHCDIPHVLPPGHPFLAAEGDVAGLHRALATAAERSAEWPAIAQAARRRIEAEFDCARQGERLAALYRQAVAA